MTKARILADYVAGGTTAAEFDYMDGVTSNVQPQLDAKLALAGGTMTGDLVPATPLSHRNVIYNGDCRIAQRGTTSTNPTSGPNTVDGFRFDSGSAGNATCTQATVSGTNAPGEFDKSFKVEQTTTVSPGSTAYQIVMRKVEAHDCQQFNATTGTKAMVLSFWVKANYADTFTTGILNIDGVRIINFQYTTVADEWQKVTHVIPADSSGGSYTDNNDRGVELRWWLTAGSNYIGNASTSWKANDVDNTKNSFDNPAFSTDGREWEITGVQLEQGGSATPFEHKSIAEEFAKCQRYFQIIQGNGADSQVGSAFWWNNAELGAFIPLTVPMRSACTLIAPTGTNYYRWQAGSAAYSTAIDGIGAHAPNRTGMGTSKQVVSISVYKASVSGTWGQAGSFYVEGGAFSGEEYCGVSSEIA